MKGPNQKLPETITVSVCIPTYNQASFLGAAIDSVFSQKGNLIKELIISDDASTDETEGKMQSYLADPRVRYFRQPKNLGISANNNFAMKQATGDLIIRLDSDDLLLPEFAQVLALRFYKNAEIGVAHVRVLEIDEHGMERRLRRLNRAEGFQSGADALKVSHQGFKVAANICMFRKIALEECGYYRDGLDFAEDWDLWVRLADNGWGNCYVDQLLAKYRVWNDAGGYRKGRKAVEIEGISAVFMDSIAPAFERRNWNSDCLLASRKSIARGHARSLGDMPRESAEFRQVVELLRRLGDSAGLQIRIGLVRWGFAPVMDHLARWELAARDLVKRKLILRQPE